MSSARGSSGTFCFRVAFLRRAESSREGAAHVRTIPSSASFRGSFSRLVQSGDDEQRGAALRTLELDHQFRIARAEAAARRGGRSARPVTFARIGGQPNRTIYDQGHSETQTPRTPPVRTEGQAPVGGQVP